MAEALGLGVDDLGDVLEETLSSSTKWYKTGLRLKVPVAKLDGIRREFSDQQECLCEMLKEWLKSTAGTKPSWEVLVEALRSRTVGETQLADQLETNHCQSERSSQGSFCTVLENSLTIQLKTKIEHLKSTKCTTKQEEESRTDMIKAVVREYITESQQSGSTKEHIEGHLQELHRRDFLLSEFMYEWARQLVTEVFVEAAVDESSFEPISPSESREPLFCKDTVYHASVCCHAINECDAGNYQKFFKTKEKVPGHSLQEVSISRSKQDRYLIARQGESTFYFAFQSEPDLLKWPKLFKSFNEGIKKQSERFPVRFIVELLSNRKCCIILTGFSFGGLLACAVAACVWDSPYISSSLLKENLACITFAQPHIPVPWLSEVTRERPDLVSTIHTVYWEEDPVPRLARFLNKCCSSLESEKSKASLQLKMRDQVGLPFQDPVTILLFDHLGKVLGSTTKDGQSPDTIALSDLKAALKDIAPKLVSAGGHKQVPFCTTSYLISCDLSTGLQWGKMTAEQAFLQSSYLHTGEIETLTIEVLKKHSIAEYCQKIFRSFLEKFPEYIPSSPAKQSLTELTMLKPSVTSVELHSHGNELAIVVEGSNLWFCYQISIGGHTVHTPAHDLSGTSIQFNVQREESKVKVEEGKVIAILCSHFSKKPLNKEVPALQKEYPVTSRQRQLARLTPSQLIELAYLSALLEQHPYSQFQPNSHKVEVIRRFLEDVVQVVPLESIAHAIAYGKPDKIAIQCAKALMSAQLRPPLSDLMGGGYFKAFHRLHSGVSPDIIEDMKIKALKQLPGFMPDWHSITTDSKQLTLILRDEKRTPITATSLEWEKLKEEYSEVPSQHVAPEKVQRYVQQLNFESAAQQRAAMKQGDPINVICGLNIAQLYPVTTDTTQQTSALKSPLDILRSGKRKLDSLARKAQEGAPVERFSSPETQHSKKKSTSSLQNILMLKTVNEIRQGDLAICTSLLGGFMEQQEIDIPLVKSRRDRSKALSLSGRASVGVWALSSLDYSAIQPILTRCHGNQLLVKIENYVKVIFSEKTMATKADDNQYAAKLQFIVQGVRKTVTCNTQYISYSLERQLSELCEARKIDTHFPLDRLVGQWGKLFEENILSLVAFSHRPLIARWLKWALMVHHLREELAKYTAVGVIGLVNSGKSRLVNTLFGIKIPTGTTEVKRTTVPFMYNLDDSIEGLDVVDFPGVDDRDESISDLADLLLTLAQIVIFVVDYRKVHTESAKKWLERLQEESVPVLVCLTFADKLYAEHMTEYGKHPSKESMKYQLGVELSAIQEKLGTSSARTVKFFSFSQDRDSVWVQNCKEGTHRLREVGIGTPLEVGEWLVDVFQKRFGQDDLADRLHSFIHKTQEP